VLALFRGEMSDTERELAEMLHKKLGTYRSIVMLNIMKRAIVNNADVKQVLNELAKLVGEEASFQ